METLFGLEGTTGAHTDPEVISCYILLQANEGVSLINSENNEERNNCPECLRKQGVTIDSMGPTIQSPWLEHTQAQAV